MGFRASFRRSGADGRHHGNVEQVADTGAAQMRVAEADDGGVGVMVAGAPVPALRDAGGSQLHKAEGNIGPHEHMSMSAGSDLGIHKRSVVFRCFGTAGGQ